MTGKTISIIWLVGSVITLLTVFVLLKEKRPLDAGAVILISPFPCPPGIPC